MDPLDLYGLDEPSAQDLAKALARQGRERQLLGLIGQLSGDRAISPVARQVQEIGAAVPGQVGDVLEKRAGRLLTREQLAQKAAQTKESLDFRNLQFGETQRHNRAVENRPQMPLVIQTTEGAFTMPRTPGATATPVVGPDGKPLMKPKKERVLQTHDKDLLDSLTGEVNALSGLEGSFKPAFAGQGPAGGLLTQGYQVLGSAGTQSMQQQASFWSDFSRLIDLPQRNKVFGASLSAGEKSSWEGAKNIKPGTDPALVQRKLAEMKGILSTKLQNIGASLTEEGYDPDAIAKRTGGLTVKAPGGPPQQRAKAKDGKWYVQTPMGWDLDLNQGGE